MSSSGDKNDRFMALFDPVHSRLEHFVLALTRNREAARDIVGDTVMIAYERFDSLRDPEAFLSFLFTIARRVYQQRARTGRRSEPLEESHWAGLCDPQMAPDVAADITAVYDALDSLPEPQREAVALFEILGLSTKEIQQIQGGTLIAVKVRLSRGRRRLAKLLGVEESPRQQRSRSASAGAIDRNAIDSLSHYPITEEL